jgi:hypothetical protein
MVYGCIDWRAKDGSYCWLRIQSSGAPDLAVDE